MRDDAVLRRALPLGRGLGRIQSWRPLANYTVKANYAAWCICSVKSCVIHAERFRSGDRNRKEYCTMYLRRYTNGIPLTLPFFELVGVSLHSVECPAFSFSFIFYFFSACVERGICRAIQPSSRCT